MRIRLKLGSLFLLLFFLVSLTPAQAAILPVDPRNPPISVLNKDEVDKLSALYSTTSFLMQGDVSPDETYVPVVVRTPRGSAFTLYNIKNNSFGAVDFSDPKLAFAGFITELRWINNTTLFALGINEDFDFLAVSIDATTLKVKGTPISLPGLPYTLSPNGQNLILVVPPSGSAASGAGKFVSPFDITLRRSTRTPYELEENNFDRRLFKSGDDTLRIASVSLPIVSVDLTTGKAAKLFDLPEGTALSFLSWSADSSKLAFTRTVDFSLFVNSIGRQNSLLGDFIAQDALGQLPPDQNPFFLTNQVDAVDFKAGRVAEGFLKARGGNGDIFSDVAWNSDGTVLMTEVEKPSRLTGRKNPIYVNTESVYFNFYGLDGTRLGTLENSDINSPFYSIVSSFVSKDEVLFLAPNRTDYTFFYYNRVTGEFRRLPFPSGSVLPDFGFALARQSRQIIAPFSSYTQVRELFRINFDGTGLTKLTNANANLAAISQVKVNEVSFTLSKGQTRTGYLIQPAGAAFPPQNQPIVVWQEGGPTSNIPNYWVTQVERPWNILPQFGLSVLVVPLPGRLGYGKDFLNDLANGDNFGKIDIDEQAEITRQMISQGWTSQGKVGITGCSYGGYFTAQSIVRYPDLYAAANPQCSALDYFYIWQFDAGPYFFYLIGNSPTVNANRFIEVSPLYNANKVKAATLIFHGTNDFLPITNAANFHDQIQNNGAAVNLYAFNREGHGLAARNSQISAAQLQIQWFRQYLGVR